jgi:glycosyltransferase involved in cell wall biosynthesis
MKIAFIGQGNSLHFWRRTNWYAKRGHKVMILSYHWPEMPRYEDTVDLRTFPFEMKHQDPLWILDWMEKQIGKFSPDLVHVHKCDYPGIFGLFLNYSPMVFTLWDGIYVRDPRIPYGAKQLIRIAGEKAELFTCNSTVLLEECIEKGVPREKTLLTSWGVSPDVFNIDSARNCDLINEIRKKHGIREGERIVFSPRVLTHFSNIDILVQVIDAVVEKFGESVRFLFAAYIVTQDGIFSFGHLLRSIRHRDRVHWCGHIRDERELSAYYQLSDVVVSLYSGYLESSPASIIEAMMSGAIPVVAELPVVRFWVEDKKNGFLTKPRDIKNVTKKILEALTMAETQPNVRRENHEKAKSKANYPETMAMMETCYKEIVRGNHAGFIPPKLGQRLHDQGLLLEVFQHQDNAYDFYSLARKEDQGGDIKTLLRSFKQARHSDKRYVDPKARDRFQRDVSPLDIPPPPSGDIREYVWAAMFKKEEDIPRLYTWLNRLSDTFQYDLDYLSAVFFEHTESVDEYLVFLYLTRYCPQHIGLSRWYLKLSRKLEFDGDRRKALYYYQFILEAWRQCDHDFQPYIDGYQKLVAEAAYHSGVIHLLENKSSAVGREYFLQALQFDPNHRLARVLLKNMVSPLGLKEADEP